MSHTFGRGGGGEEAREEPSGRAGRELARQVNLLGALSLAVNGRLESAVEPAAGHGGAAPAALVALAGFLSGASIDTLRRPLGLSHSAAVRLVDRLAEAELVKREPARDGRSVSVRLTPAGESVAERVRRERAAALEAVLEPLSAAERAELATLHEKLLAGLTGGRADAGRTCRLCDADACGHYEGRCPVTLAADLAERSAA